MKDSDVFKQTESIKGKIQELIKSGQFSGVKKLAQESGNSARNASLSAMNLEPATNQAEAINRLMTPGKFYFFVSSSMPKGQLSSLLKSLVNTNDSVEVVYRGLFEGNRTLGDFTRQAGRQLRDMGIKETNAMVGLNPTAFREFGITKVPTVAYVHPDQTNSQLSGVVNLELFKDQLLESGKDFGNDGATFEIAEKDFFVEIQERMAKIDWNKKSKEAESKYWESIKPYNLPVSLTSESFDVDMTVDVTNDIYADYNGKRHVIARAGQSFNPMLQPSMRQFNRRILVFNPNEERQLLWAKDQVDLALSKNERPMVMLTELLKNNKVKTLFNLEEFLKVQIYLLQDAVVGRFGINKIPVMVKKSASRSGYMRISYFSCVEDRCYE